VLNEKQGKKKQESQQEFHKAYQNLMKEMQKNGGSNTSYLLPASARTEGVTGNHTFDY
jgi:hypothetical protein